jgi:hypothetical protein
MLTLLHKFEVPHLHACFSHTHLRPKQVRNLVGRCPHLVESLSEDGMEPLLRHAGTLPGSVDAAYAALRDLGFEVEVSGWVPGLKRIRSSEVNTCLQLFLSLNGSFLLPSA